MGLSSLNFVRRTGTFFVFFEGAGLSLDGDGGERLEMMPEFFLNAVKFYGRSMRTFGMTEEGDWARAKRSK